MGEEAQDNRILSSASKSLEADELLWDTQKHMSWLVRSETGASLFWLLDRMSREIKDQFFEMNDITETERLQVKGVLIAYSGLRAAIQEMAAAHEAREAGGEEDKQWAETEPAL
jgi:hypothetical protein